MAHGINIYTTLGAKQLSDEGRGLRVLASGTVSAAYFDSEDGPELGIAIPGNCISGDRFVFLRNTASGNRFASTVLAQYNSTNSYSYFPVWDFGTYEYVIVTYSGWSQPTSGYGLLIKNSSDDVVFSSESELFVLTSVITIPITNATTTNTQSYTISVAPYVGATPYVLGSSSEFLALSTGSPGQVVGFSVHMSFINNDTLSVRVTRGDTGAMSGVTETTGSFNIAIGVKR